MSTLLEKAKRRKPLKQKEVTNDEIELALAWVRGEIGVMQAKHALGAATNNAAYISFAHALAKYIRRMGLQDQITDPKNLPQASAGAAEGVVNRGL